MKTITKISTWEEAAELGPSALARQLGCPVTTASSWLHRSPPPEWQQRIYIYWLSRDHGDESSAPERTV